MRELAGTAHAYGPTVPSAASPGRLTMPHRPDCSHDSKTQEVKPCITHLPYSSISVTRRPVLAVALVGPPVDVHSLEAERAREYFKAGNPLPAVFRDAYVSDVNRAG